MYQHIYFYFYAMILIIIGALNWGAIGAFDTNLVEKFIPTDYQKLIYILVAAAAIYLMMDRNTYLPFLNDTVLPCYNFENKEPSGFDTVASVKVPKNVKVIYWAALPKDPAVPDGRNGFEEAYGDYSNSGITTSDSEGEAKLRIKFPQSYTVKKFGIFSSTLQPHVHYRFCRANGMMSEVKTYILPKEE